MGERSGRGASLRASRLAAAVAALALAVVVVPWVARAASPSPTGTLPAGMSMDARVLLEGHARTGS